MKEISYELQTRDELNQMSTSRSQPVELLAVTMARKLAALCTHSGVRTSGLPSPVRANLSGRSRGQSGLRPVQSLVATRSAIPTGAWPESVGW
jgi:hypothetical protein